MAWKYLIFILLSTHCLECYTQIKLNSTMRRYITKIGREMFGIGVKTTAEPFDIDNEYEEEPISWLNIDDENKKKARKDKKNKSKKQKIKKNKVLESVGPPGPPGPAGESGSSVSVPILMSQVRKMLRSTSLRTSLKSGGNDYLSQMITYGVPDVIIGFAALTGKNIQVPKKSHVEVYNLEVSKPGCFQRGNAFNSNTGKFTALVTAVYSFHAILHISIPKDLQNLIRKDYITVSLCINGDFINKRAISVTEGMGTNSRVFSVNIIGSLYLQTGDFVSLFIHNNSPKHNIVITRNSYFSGMLVGT